VTAVTEKFIVGLVGSPFGVKGFVKVLPLSGDIENLLKLKLVTIIRDGKERKIKIADSCACPPSVLMRFEGIDNPEIAKTLGNAQLIVDRELASPLAAGEFYIEDLKGLAVTAATDGGIIGHVVDMVEGGGGELVEIELCEGKKKLVPFRQEFFPEINPEEGRMILQNLWILE
jgi:16S rRNA processing protein RimM